MQVPRSACTTGGSRCCCGRHLAPRSRRRADRIEAAPPHTTRVDNSCMASPAAVLAKLAMSRILVRGAFALGAVATSMVLCGCAPILASFVQPQAPGGTITNGLCPPQPEVLQF